MKSAVQDLMKQVSEQKAQSRADVVAERERKKRRQHVRWAQAGVVLLVFVASVLFSLPRWRQPFPPPTGAAAERDARKALVFAASLVDRFEQRSGRLPGSFSQVGATLPGVSYQRIGNTYVLSSRVDGRDVTFHKGDDPASFLAAGR